MDRRDFLGLGTLSLVATPKSEVPEVKAHQTQMYMYMLVRALAQTMRFEMSNAQWIAYSGMVTEISFNNPTAAGTANALPITVNPDLPKDEVRLVAHDGTIMARITGLALPCGF